MKYNEWLDIWLAEYVKPISKERTYNRYESLCNNYIRMGLGEIELDELSGATLQKFVANLLATKSRKHGKLLSSAYVNSIISVVQNSLKKANLMEYSNMCNSHKIQRPKTSEKQIKCFSESEQKQIEDAILSDKKKKMTGIIICLYTGIRIGELLALTWEDIDFEHKLISITKSCYDTTIDGNHRRVITTPKTQSSKRIIPIPRSLIPMLRELKKASDCMFIISENGHGILVRSYQRSFELFLRRLNIPHRGFHALRHTFATRAVECRMDVKTLSEILGHRNASITLNRYVHSQIEHKTAMMNRLGNIFGKKY